MKRVCIVLCVVVFFSIGKCFAQKKAEMLKDLNPKNKNDTLTLVEYYTMLNDYLSAMLLVESRNDSKEFIYSYYDVKSAYNKFLNSVITDLILLKSKKALISFKNTNSKIDRGELNSAYKKLVKLSALSGNESSNETEAFLPATVSIAELTGIAGQVIGLINKAKERKDIQKGEILKVLASLKIPPITQG